MLQVCKSPDALLFNVSCADEKEGAAAAAVAPCEVQWALQASGFAVGSGCATTAEGEPVSWTSAGASSAVVEVGALVARLQGSAAIAQLQL